MKYKNLILLTTGLLLLSILLTACQVLEEGVDSVAQTYAAETLAAVQTITPVAQNPKETNQIEPTTPPTQTPLPTETPRPDPTDNDEEHTTTCNAATFIDDVTVEDRTVMDPNEAFTKVWRIKNSGTCTWTGAYQVIFSSGYLLDAVQGFELSQNVAPGETVDITINMEAPATKGTYTGYWMLKSDNEEVFGVGADNASPFWVRIRVTEDDEYVIYNFAENVCQAGWESSLTENIACPSDENPDKGFVQFVDQPTLENGVAYNEPAILTYPDAGRSGYIVGRYPDIVIEEGDHFQATIGCQYGAESCNVNYTLRVVVTGEGLTLLGSWREVYKGKYYPIDVDLSDYAGVEVELVLSAIAVDDSSENYALWLDPRIVRQAD